MKTKHALIVVIALVVSSAQMCSSNPVFGSATSGTLNNDGNQFLKKREYEKALQYYNGAIAQDPTAWGPYISFDE